MRRTAQVIGIVLALLLLAVLCIPLLVSADRFKPALESTLSTAIGRQVTIGSLRLSLLAGGVSADNLAIADDQAFSRTPFLQARSLKVAVELWPLITARKLNVTGLTIDEPQVTLLQSRDGRWNYSTMGGKSAPSASPGAEPASGDSLDLSARRIRIVNGRFSLGRAGAREKPLALEGVNLEIRDFASSVAFPFSFSAKVAGGGDIKLEGKAGPIDAGNAALTPLSASLDVRQLNLAGTAPDIGGIASLQANVASRSGRLDLKGKLSAEGLKLAKNATPARRTVELEVENVHDLRKQAGTLRIGNIHVGSALASLTGTYADRGDATWLNMKFAGNNMPMPELAELMPALGVALPNGSSIEGGTATVALAVEGPAAGPTVEGTLTVQKTRLANFDLGTKMTVIQKLAGIKSGPNTDIEILEANVKHTPEGTAVERIHCIAQGVGELEGAGTVNPAKALDFKMSATIQTSRSAALSETAVPFFIQGTAMDPVFKPDVGGLAKEQAKSLLQSEAQKRLKGSAGEAAGGILERLLGGKKKK